MPELKPCPFCGGTPTHVGGDDSDDGDLYFVVCSVCLAEGPNVTTKKDAIKLWNARAK